MGQQLRSDNWDAANDPWERTIWFKYTPRKMSKHAGTVTTLSSSYDARCGRHDPSLRKARRGQSLSLLPIRSITLPRSDVHLGEERWGSAQSTANQIYGVRQQHQEWQERTTPAEEATIPNCSILHTALHLLHRRAFPLHRPAPKTRKQQTTSSAKHNIVIAGCDFLEKH